MTEERRYEVLSVLGRGGFGTVYHARFIGEGGFSKEVALKVLNPEMENVAEIASRLRDEARMLALIRHRAVVGVDRLTQIEGRWTVVMEYVEGHDLAQLARRGCLPVGVSLEIVAEIAGALHAAYTRAGPDGKPLRLLHRDLKPSNVRVTPFGEVKVLDFGIARAEFGQREARTRSLALGTPDYMSPERLDFSADSASGDVYALGAILFELLTGDPLGRSSANPARHQEKIEQAAATLAELAPPPAVAELLWRMLDFDARNRPSAAEVERRAAALARQVADVSLREWVDRLPPSDNTPAQHSDPAHGSVLVERTNPRPVTPDTGWDYLTPSTGQRRPETVAPPRPTRSAAALLPPELASRIPEDYPPELWAASLGAPRPARRTPGWLVVVALLFFGGGLVVATALYLVSRSVTEIRSSLMEPATLLTDTATMALPEPVETSFDGIQNLDPDELFGPTYTPK